MLHSSLSTAVTGVKLITEVSSETGSLTLVFSDKSELSVVVSSTELVAESTEVVVLLLLSTGGVEVLPQATRLKTKIRHTIVKIIFFIFYLLVRNNI